MMKVNYQKRKNLELFQSLEDSASLFLSKTQNYIPVYKRFFELNETNFNNINLNHKWFITSVDIGEEDEDEEVEDEEEEVEAEINAADADADADAADESSSTFDDFPHIFNCRIKNIQTNKTKDKEVFFKMAPLLDPLKYLMGKYNNIAEKDLFALPSLHSTEINCHPKILDANNSAYVDGLFLFLSSNLIAAHNFSHGVEYYGSFLALKHNFMVNIFDDIEYLRNSDFFVKHKNGELFSVDDYSHLFPMYPESEAKLSPLTIKYNSPQPSLSAMSFDDGLEERGDCCCDDDDDENNDDLEEIAECAKDFIETPRHPINGAASYSMTLKSSSTCSSRTSYTIDGEVMSDCEDCGDCDVEEKEEKEEKEDEKREKAEDGEDKEGEEEDNNSRCDSEGDDDEYDEERLNAMLSAFPVQVIGMECCESTFDDLILSKDLSTEEWFSALMQIIMILVTYQKAFSFTHNDLHSNNIMYNVTDKKFVHYCFKKKYYKVPTFGRIFKIIDFGRSIYKFDGKTFCSDSFQLGNDAATQYNTEPYFNDSKPRLEPNFSFDLCRLACSVFDCVIEDITKIKNMEDCDAVQRIIFDWCLDDKGLNVLYKNNGVDRYPDFKLYKMIARCVHNHTPQAQLERPEFKAYLWKGSSPPKDVINIDEIPLYV